MDSGEMGADCLIDGIGLWLKKGASMPVAGQPALFLDRDGVLVEEMHFLSRAEDVQLTEGIADALIEVSKADIPIILVTNQSGIARGLFGWGEFACVQREIGEQLAAFGVSIDLTLACGFHKTGHGDLANGDHPWRKPGPGMLFEAQARLGVLLERSVILGDRLTDLQAGKTAGLRRGYLVMTGYGGRERASLLEACPAWKKEGFEAKVAANAAEAIRNWLSESTFPGKE